MKRTTCSICENSVYSFLSYKMPVYMGTSELTASECSFEDMAFQHCQCCGAVQIGVEIDSSVLYQSNHNRGVIGKTWEEHYRLFYDFISDDLSDKMVLEISDPSAKLARLGSTYRKWTIIEPNPDFVSDGKIRLINDYFGDNFDDGQKYDVVVHSHYMEHCFDVRSFLTKCHSVLVDGGLMVFSIPDMQWLLSHGKIPNNILHFEHTCYLDEDLVRQLLHNSGFVVVAVQRYANHSLFFKCLKCKVPPKKNRFQRGNVVKESIEQIHTHCLSEIEVFNQAISDKKSKAYLFGCHVSSQYYIQNGLANVDGILDNSSWKIGKRLYGTDYITLNPFEIVGQDSPIVICSACGSYKEEVCNQLRALNPSVILL